MQEVNSIKKVYSVSELTEKIKLLLEEEFPIVWVFGEISNFRIPSSGHSYFTLKDRFAQISAVMFKAQTRNLKFQLQDGMSIVGLGRISLYEPRGAYQIILEYAEPKGAGALQVAFEQLKRRLAEEGLFDSIHKSIIPLLPGRVCVITSPTGAVIRDILNIVHRRCPGLPIEILPVSVQGDTAAEQISKALAIANLRASSDVIILARGGGSLEDLAPFNSEVVARAIFASRIPVVSAIGHETDYTISDFVADLRAPTPSAAAELVAPLRSELQSRCLQLRQRCEKCVISLIQRFRDKKTFLSRALMKPLKQVQELNLRSDDLTHRLQRMLRFHMQQYNARIRETRHRIQYNSPMNHLNELRYKLNNIDGNLLNSIYKMLSEKSNNLRVAGAAIAALNPISVLQRGYSITRTKPDHKVVITSDAINKGQLLEVELYQGKIDVSVISK